MTHVLFNPKSNNGQGVKIKEELTTYLNEKKNTASVKAINNSAIDVPSNDNLEFVDVIAIEDTNKLLDGYDENDFVIIAGGDGTLNRFINDTYGRKYGQNIFFYSAGSGNDFLHDVCGIGCDKLISLNGLIESLPTVTVNGITKHFINGIGFGIDGYCCEVGDKLRAISDKPVNYAGIAIKGLLFHFKPANATITVDGVTKSYKKAWLAPTMFGRYYGGGMMIAPKQDRQNKEHTVSSVIMYGSGKLKTLIVFPTIFKGEHISHTDMIEIREGHEVTVEFDKPIALQIDGETVLGVTKYSVSYK